MNWILVVLQTTAVIGTNTVNTAEYGWTVLGEFQSQKACAVAADKLIQAGQGVRGNRGVKAFQCLNQQEGL